MARILIIDDNVEFCAILQAHLETAGHAVAMTNRARDGLALLERESFDLLLTDILMPEVDGIEVLRMVKRRWPGLPVIAVSGGGQIAARDLLEMVDHLGADRVLQKPVRREDLLKAIDTLLDELLDR